MIEIVLALALVAVVYIIVHAFQQELASERARVNELLSLLESKAAPAEYAAIVQYPEAPEDDSEWVASDDGLIVVKVDD